MAEAEAVEAKLQALPARRVLVAAEAAGLELEATLLVEIKLLQADLRPAQEMLTAFQARAPDLYKVPQENPLSLVAAAVEAP